MKKVLSVIMALVIILTLGVSVSALSEPGVTEYCSVVIDGKLIGDKNATSEIVVKGDTIIIKTVAPTDEDISLYAVSFYLDTQLAVAARLDIDFNICAVRFAETDNHAVYGLDYEVDEKGRIISLKGDIFSIEIKPIATNIVVTGCYKNNNGSGKSVDGDVNLDENIDAIDLAMLKKIIAKIIVIDDTVNPEVDNNGVVDVADLAYLKKLIAGFVVITE